MSDFKSTITDFQRQAFSGSLLFGASLIWVSFLLNDAYAETVSKEITMLMIATELACIAAFWLRDIRFDLARLVPVGSLWVCNVAAMIYIPAPLFLYVFGPLVFLTYNLSKMKGLQSILAISFLASNQAISPRERGWLGKESCVARRGCKQRLDQSATRNIDIHSIYSL